MWAPGRWWHDGNVKTGELKEVVQEVRWGFGGQAFGKHLQASALKQHLLQVAADASNRQMCLGHCIFFAFLLDCK